MLPNRVCDAADLINWCALFTNPDRIAHSDAEDLNYDDDRWLHYDDGRETARPDRRLRHRSRIRTPAA
jgi:conjugal transfer ATP-binding protein TraC